MNKTGPMEKKLKYICDLVESDGWDFIMKSGENIVEKKLLQESPIACVMSNGFVDAYPKEIYEYIWGSYNKDDLQKLDQDISHFEIVKYLNDDTRLCYQINNLSWPLWPRDLSYLQCRKTVGDTYWIYMFSIDSDEIPQFNDKYVRAIINISGYGLIPENGGTRLYRLVHLDPSGQIPTSIINNYSGKTLDAIENIQKIFNSN